MRRLRIALVSRRYPPQIGGAEKVLSYLAIGLAGQGAEVTVLTSRLDPTSPATEIVPVPGDSGGSLRVERLATSRLRFLGTWLYMRNLARWFRRNRPDLAYVSMLKHDAYVALGEGERLGFPVVLRPEGAGSTGDVAWQKWGRGGERIAARCRTADAFVAISPAVESELVADGYPAGRILRLPNGVPVPETPWIRNRGNKPNSGAGPVAAFVGRLAPEKGLDILLDAWPAVRKSFPGAKILLIGEGSERPALQEKAAQLRISDSLEMPGTSADPLRLLGGADLFILPSREEGMSVALLEALALGIPAVVSAIPGNLGLVSDGVEARTFSPGDPADLARVVVEAWSDPTSADARASAGRAKVAREFSIEAVSTRHLVAFRQLCLNLRN